MRLADKVAIVTGAGSGFGEGIATRFAAEGAKVVVNDVDSAHGERVAAAIRQAGGQATFVRADVSRGDDVKALLQATLAAYGRLDIQINNAGVSHRNQSMLTVPEDEFDRVYAVNVKSLYWTAQHMAPHFRDNGGGVFINIASTGGVRPRPGHAQAGVVALGRAQNVLDVGRAQNALGSARIGQLDQHVVSVKGRSVSCGANRCGQRVYGHQPCLMATVFTVVNPYSASNPFSRP